MANIALIGPKANIRISKKNPMDYVAKYNIDDEKLAQQYIEPSLATTDIGELPAWIDSRAERLAKAGNELLTALRGDLEIPDPIASEATTEHAYDGD